MEDAAIGEFERACQNVASNQEEVLRSILCDNAGCNYLQKHGNPQDSTAFKSRVPVVSYDDVAGDIRKIADGDTSPVLCCYPITYFFASSGTSAGKPKIILVTDENWAALLKASSVVDAYTKRYFLYAKPLPDLCSTRCFPNVGTGRVLGFLFCIGQLPTKSGIPVGPASTFFIHSESFREKSSRFTTPYEMLLAGSNWQELTYCHLVCALLQRDEVEEIEGYFAYMICEAVRVLQNDWQEICSNIRTGSLSRSKVTNSKLREAFASFLSSRVSSDGSKDLAEDVLAICSRVSWSGILSSLFPRLKVVWTVVTGTMTQFVPVLRNYVGEKVAIAGRYYASSEGMIGISTNPASPPEQVVYTISPQTLYYEFLPVGSPVDEVVSAHEVVIGKQYELVITNFAGLYRYRIGDVVEVASKFHGAPQLAFRYRKNAVLSVHNEMVDEQELQNVVMKVTKEAGIQVTNFACHADVSISPAHYVIFWELESSEAKAEVLAKCCSDLDRSLNQVYIGKRLDGALGPLEVVIVKRGTFEKLMEEAIQSGTSPAQYKTPRCINSSRMLEVLNSERLESYKSEEMQARAHRFVL